MSTVTIDTATGPVTLRWPSRIAAHIHASRYWPVVNAGDVAALAELQVLAVAACWPTRPLTPADVGLDPKSIAADRAFLLGASAEAHSADVKAAEDAVNAFNAEYNAVTRGNYGPKHLDALLDAMGVTPIAACAVGESLLTAAMLDSAAGAMRHRELSNEGFFNPLGGRISPGGSEPLAAGGGTPTGGGS